MHEPVHPEQALPHQALHPELQPPTQAVPQLSAQPPVQLLLQPRRCSLLVPPVVFAQFATQFPVQLPSQSALQVFQQAEHVKVPVVLLASSQVLLLGPVVPALPFAVSVHPVLQLDPQVEVQLPKHSPTQRPVQLAPQPILLPSAETFSCVS